MVLDLPHVQRWIVVIRMLSLAIIFYSYPREPWERSLVMLWLGFALYSGLTLVPVVSRFPALLSRDLTVAADAALASFLIYTTGGMTSPCIFVLYLP
ncbi:MAG: hypothetical protein KY468_11265, partial [Armatimonadetes bacterium]|nr:hypothetical protein [Armatimonadota bacterium]